MAGSSGTTPATGSPASTTTADRQHGSATNSCSGPASETSLAVQIERSDGKPLSAPADVKIAGPSPRNDKTAKDTGRVTFKPIDAGAYKVSVKGNGDESEFEGLPPHPQDVTVTQGQEALATLKIAPPLKAYLYFAYTDPDGTERDLPKDFKVVLVYNDNTEVSAKLNDKGIGMAGSGTTAGIPIDRSKTDFTLNFTSNGSEFIIVEKPGDTPASEIGGMSRLVDDKRGFMLPKDKWTISNSDWTVTNATNYASNKFTTLSDPNTVIGTESAPVKLVLNPHWQYHKFEYFDRVFGASDHHKRISAPAVLLEGFRTAPTTATIKPDTSAKWLAGTDALDMKQALPWILTKNEDGTAPLPKLNKDMEIRFKTDASTGNYVYAKSATEREVKALAATATELQPGPERMAYYDLPNVWRSRAYYTRKAGSTDGKFFKDLTETDIEAANTATTPLIFCLDDIILYKEGTSGLEPLDPLSATDKVVIFHHKFDNTDTNCTVQGVYKTLPFAEGPADGTELPSSKVVVNDNYLTDYVDWTRLIIAQGNLFDVFSDRTPDSTVAERAVGARAAVRWIDAMEPLATKGFTLYSFATSSTEPAGKPLPGYAFFNNSYTDQKRPDPTAKPFFAIQHFWCQRTATRYSKPYHVDNDELAGRFDIALLRCCGLDSGKEVAVNLHYLKSYFNFILTPTIGKQKYAHDLSLNVCNRWNGNDTAVNTTRARFTPRGSGTLKPIVVDVVWFCQSVIEDRAHFAVKVENIDRANRGGQSGTGQSGPNGYKSEPSSGHPNWFPTAHESGHMDGLPDEYNEQWDGASYDQQSLKCNLPGDPYRIDSSGAMMNKNESIHNRYFWHAAEWTRRRIGGDIHLQVVHKQKNGTEYKEYFVPEHSNPLRTYTYWPLQTHLKPDAPLPVLPASAKDGLRDLFLYTLGKDHFSQKLLPELEDPPGTTPYDGVLVVIVKMKFWLEKWNDATTNKDKRSQILQAAIKGAESLNYSWYASGKAPIPGSSPAASHTFSRCLIHFSPRVVVENHIEPGEVAAVDPNDPQPGEETAKALGIINALKVHYRVVVDEVDPPKTRWLSSADVADLETGTEFENRVPAVAKTETIIQELKTKLNEYHAIDAFHLPERIAKVGEIQTQAESYLEPGTAVDDTWTADTTAADSRPAAAKTGIDQALTSYRSAATTDYTERHTRLALVKTRIDAFAEAVNLKSDWRATTNTMSIDAAVTLYENLPAIDHNGRIAALGAIQTAVSDFVAATRRKAWLFNVGLYNLIPKAEALAGRARDKKGEVALLRGISVMKPVVEARIKVLAILIGTSELARRSGEVKTDLEEKEESVQLWIEYNGDSNMLPTVRDEMQKYFMSMLGVYKLPNEITRDDLIPIVRNVIPTDTDVQPVA